MNNFQKAQAFRHAATLIRRDGWVQQVDKDYYGHRCVAQALLDGIVATSGQDRETAMLSYQAEFGPTVLRRLGHTYIPTWNDTPGRRVEDILMFLEVCAYDLENPSMVVMPFTAGPKREESDTTRTEYVETAV